MWGDIHCVGRYGTIATDTHSLPSGADMSEPTVRITVRLPQSIREAAERKAKSHGTDLGRYVRRLLSADLGVDEPEMRPGNAALSDERVQQIVRRAAAARWAKSPKKTHKKNS